MSRPLSAHDMPLVPRWGHARLGVDLVAQDLVLERVSPEDEGTTESIRTLVTSGRPAYTTGDSPIPVRPSSVSSTSTSTARAGKLPW